VNCHVDDGRGGTADSRVNVTSAKPKEQIQLEARLSLHSIYFPTAQPTIAKPTGGLVASQQTTLVVWPAISRDICIQPDARLTLQGHADLRGGTKYNQGLSDRRVERTKSFLVEKEFLPAVLIRRVLARNLLQTRRRSRRQSNRTGPDTGTEGCAYRNVRDLALAQSRRVDVTLPSTGQTSQQEYPFNAADAINLIDPKGLRPGEKAETKSRKPIGKKPPITKKAGTTTRRLRLQRKPRRKRSRSLQLLTLLRQPIQRAAAIF